MTEVPCPGERCTHPPGHIHLEYEDGCGQVWDSEGRLLDPFDLARTAVLLLYPKPKPRRSRKRR